ncbi:putative non-structural protein [Dysaphis plantaginea densovirus]|uniref:Non-structural protein n=1 Tax=Dysaphis plantaginea densovirus 1 TaxID=3070906 RepID=B5TYI8_9VIRU|nr:putative non-structural protein [Dysaphis plantaginea densovirus]ACI01074.1 putative non-structural protein [Dysaphis plantaginea densovirus]
MEAIQKTPEHKTADEDIVLTPPPTPKKKQSMLRKKHNSVLGFSLDEPRQKKQKPQELVKISTGPTSSQTVTLVSSDEEENELNEIYQTPVVKLGARMLKSSKQDIRNFEVFMSFSEALFQHNNPDYVGCLPLIALVIHMCHLPQWKLTKSVENFVASMLNPKRWRPIVQLNHWQLQAASIMCSENLETGENVWLEWMKLQPLIYPTMTPDIENWRVKHLLDIWEALPDTSRTFVSRRTARNLFNSLSMFDNYPDYLLKSKCDLCPATIPTSTSYTPALTQTVLVAVPGSVEVQSGEAGGLPDIEDEFSQLTSQLLSGKQSIDISLQMAMQSKILKAEVQMQDYVYDLKVYRKEDIKSLDKSQWYTKVYTKAVGTLAGNHPTKTKLDSIVRDLLVDIKAKKNMRMDRAYVYGQKH